MITVGALVNLRPGVAAALGITGSSLCRCIATGVTHRPNHFTVQLLSEPRTILGPVRRCDTTAFNASQAEEMKTAPMHCEGRPL